MKAGVYILFDGGLVYVRKDRTVSAVAGTSYKVPTGVKAQTSEGGKSILIPCGRVQLHGARLGDVPNGCTDHQALVDSMHKGATLRPGPHFFDRAAMVARIKENSPCRVSASPLLAAICKHRFDLERSLPETGFRLCHKASARKHRKRGDSVVRLHGSVFAWRPKVPATA